MERYKGKLFSLLGDSISTFDGCHPPECGVFYDWNHQREAGIYAPGDTWWGLVLEGLQAHLLVNHSWSGSLVCRQTQCEVESYGCSDGRIAGLSVGQVQPDVVMIFMGLNDFGWAMPPVAEQPGDLCVFSVAYDTMLEKLRARCPAAEIWCFTLPRSTWRSQPDFAAPVIRGGWHLEQYCDVIRACARHWDCKLIDLAAAGVMYDTIDGLHPNREGMQTIAAAVLAEVEKEVAGYDH